MASALSSRLGATLAICCLLSAPELSGEARLAPVREWHRVALQALRDNKLGTPMASRVLAILHTCMYDAWAPYYEKAVGTQLGAALRPPATEQTQANKERAISYAAYRALTDLLPGGTESAYKPLMKQLGYDPSDKSTDIETPEGIGNVACAAVLEFRHHDKSNQLGDLVAGNEEEQLLASLGVTGTRKSPDVVGATAPYADWSGYTPVNPAGTIPAHFPFAKPLNPNRWQPLTYTDSSGSLVLQMFSGAQWSFVAPFAMARGDEFRSLANVAPATYGTPEYEQQAQELLDLSANLTDRQKMAAEYWSGGSEAEQPLEHWLRFAEFISARDHHSLDDDVKMYFALSNAMLDASIAAWDAKRAYDSVRPATAIPFLFQGKQIRAWGGAGKGTVEMDGAKWIPYQPATSPTPPCPDFVSEESAFGAAAARILVLWTGSDRFGYSVELPKGSSKVEPGLTPHEAITLKWDSFTQAAEEAGMSGRYSGIHFRRADLAGRILGRAAADSAWAKAQSYFSGAPQQLPRDGHVPVQSPAGGQS